MPAQDRGVRRALSRLAEPLVLFPIIAVLLLAVVWSSTSILIASERSNAVRSAASSTMELADTFEAQVMRVLREIDQTLKFVKFAYARGGAGVDLNDLKARGLLPLDPQFAVSLIDPEGRVIASTRKLPSGFVGEKSFRDSPGGNSLMISRPTRGPDGEWQLHFGRHLFAASGSLQGVVTVSVRAAHLVSGFDSARLGKQGMIGIVGVDGAFRVRRTGDKLSFAGTVNGDEIAAAAGAGKTILEENSWDGTRRYTSARELLAYPLTLVIGLSEEEQLAASDARADTYFTRASVATAAVLFVIGVLCFLNWQLSLSRSNASRVLAAIESSVNAILITKLEDNGTRTVEYANPAFERITGYATTEALGSNTAFLLGGDTEQAALPEIRNAILERRDGHAVLRNYRKDGTLFWNDLYIAPVRNDRGEVTHFVEVMNDVTAAKTYEEQLAHQANFDTLTGLANRNLLQDRLQQAIANARRERGVVATMFLDIDNFKVVNDNLGHRVGDLLLQEIATRLRSCVRDSDTVARLGGDEFVLVLRAARDDLDQLEGVFTAFVEKLQRAIGAPMTLGGRQIRPACSVGISLYPQDGDDAETLLRHADAAMYRAKELGRNRFQFFTSEVQVRIQKRLDLHSSLRLAYERQEFELYYQPQVDLTTGSIVAIEALLRWRHPVRGLVGPDEFIEFAEETGLIVPIGNWVLTQACRQNKQWQKDGLPKVPIAVNMSARQCEQSDSDEVVRDALAASRLDPRYLELEITESISMANPERSVPQMERLKQAGVMLSIDDFGTGFSNFGYLRRFPIDQLKIDHSFVHDIATDFTSLAICQGIIALSHSLKLKVVAEGVENAEQLALLRRNGCDVIQGHYFSPPVTHAEMAALLAGNRRRPMFDVEAMHEPRATAL
jgi:diguanylate cyclase (GGDEF)-like protein/PAS domain S-box-containing protein